MNNTIDFSLSCEPIELFQKFTAKYGNITQEWFENEIEMRSRGKIKARTVRSWLQREKKPKEPVKILLAHIEI